MFYFSLYVLYFSFCSSSSLPEIRNRHVSHAMRAGLTMRMPLRVTITATDFELNDKLASFIGD